MQRISLLLMFAGITTSLGHAQGTINPQLATVLYNNNKPGPDFTTFEVRYRCILPKTDKMMNDWGNITHLSIESIHTKLDGKTPNSSSLLLSNMYPSQRFNDHEISIIYNENNQRLVVNHHQTSFSLMEMRAYPGIPTLDEKGLQNSNLTKTSIETFTDREEQFRYGQTLNKDQYSTLSLSMTDPSGKYLGYWTASIEINNRNRYVTFINPNKNQFLVETTKGLERAGSKISPDSMKIDSKFLLNKTLPYTQIDINASNNSYLPQIIPFFGPNNSIHKGERKISSGLMMVCYLKAGSRF